MNSNEIENLKEIKRIIILFTTNLKELSFQILTKLYIPTIKPYIISMDEKMIKFQKTIDFSIFLFKIE